MKPEWLLNPSSYPGFLKSEITNHIEQGDCIHLGKDYQHHIFYAEFDGQREKRVLVKITGLKKT